jgi:hypothetical protein
MPSLIERVAVREVEWFDAWRAASISVRITHEDGGEHRTSARRRGIRDA